MAKQEVKKEPTPPISKWAAPVLVGWLIPGGGHFLLKQRGRAALLLFSVTAMFLFGLLMRGAMFHPEKGDLLTTVINYGGFLSNLSAGILYLATTMLGYAQPDVAGHVHDYGTKFLVTAGLLNVLAMVDVYEIATGKRAEMPKMNLSHFEAALLFALFASIVLGVVTKRTDNSGCGMELIALDASWRRCSGWLG